MKVMRRGKVQWTRRVGGGAPGNRLHAHLRSLWRWAIVKGYCDTTTFARSGLPTLRTRPEQPRARRVTGDEAERLLAACSPHLRDVVIAALETGCRKQELLTLQWQQVHWIRNELYLPGAKTKTKRPRRIPISAALYEMLVRRQRGPAGQTYGPDVYVWGMDAGTRIRDIKTAWTNTCRRAGIRGLRFHDLRHEAASRKRGGRLSDARGVAVAWAYESHDDSAIPECRCRTTPCPQRPPRSLRVQRSSVSTIRVITDPGLLSRGSKGSSPSGRAILVCEIPRQR